MGSFELARASDAETLTPEPRDRRSRTDRWAVIVAVVILLAVALWTSGTFDNVLYEVGLNSRDCTTDASGATFCGEELESYLERLGNAPITP